MGQPGRIFANRNVFLLWAGQIVSQLGDSVFEIGLLWLLLERTGSTTLSGLVAMSAYLPTLLFGVASGAIVDRFDRRRLMLVADGARAAIVLLIPLLNRYDRLNAGGLGVITFALASFNVLFNPSRDALLGLLVRRDQLLAANSIIQTSWQYALLLGPVGAAILLAFAGPIHLFTANAATFLVSFLFISRIRVPIEEAAAAPAIERRAIGSELREGLWYAVRDRRILVLLLITAADNLFLMGPATIGIPIFVREVVRGDATTYAIVKSALAVGMVAGTLALNQWGRNVGYGRIVLWGIILDGLTFLPLIWVTTTTGLYVTLMIHAMAIPLIVVARPTLVHTVVPTALQGRVFSLMTVSVYGFGSLSVALTGMAAEAIPINFVYGVIAVLAAGTGAVGWLARDLRETA